MSVRDWDDVPDEQKLTPERIRQLVGDSDPGPFRRYVALLEIPEHKRCRKAALGVGGVYWPCARAVEPGSRYCPVHVDDSAHATIEVVGGRPTPTRKLANRVRHLWRRR